jgi:hypothetical protein
MWLICLHFLQVRLLRGDDMWVNDTTSPYKTVEELWDGEI